jgi:hypothetical protein
MVSVELIGHLQPEEILEPVESEGSQQGADGQQAQNQQGNHPMQKSLSIVVAKGLHPVLRKTLM